MRYQGGKSRLAKYLVPILQRYRGKDQIFFEPFCGSCAITVKMGGNRFASDKNTALIEMYRKLQSGWLPPEHISEDLYMTVRDSPMKYTPEMHAYVLIGCSWGGKWAGGYARGDGRDYSNESFRNIQKMVPKLQGIVFASQDYTKYTPKNMLIYADPPYANTTDYGEIFNAELFWETMQDWANYNTVLVSERTAPTDTSDIVWEQQYTGGIRSKQQKTPERLYLVRPSDLTKYSVESLF